MEVSAGEGTREKVPATRLGLIMAGGGVLVVAEWARARARAGLACARRATRDATRLALALRRMRVAHASVVQAVPKGGWWMRVGAYTTDPPAVYS